MILLLSTVGAGEIRPGKPGENGAGCGGDKVAFFLDDSPSSNGASTSTKRLSDNDPSASLTSLDLADVFCCTMRVAQANSSIAFTTIATMNALNVTRPPPLLYSRKRAGPHMPQNITSNTKEVNPTETNVLTFVSAVSPEGSSFPQDTRMMHAQIPTTVL